MKGTDNWWKEYAGKRCYIIFENSATGEEKRVYGTLCVSQDGNRLAWLPEDDYQGA